MSPGAQYLLAVHLVLVFALVMYAVVVAMRRARIAREQLLLARLVERERQGAPAMSSSVSASEGRKR